jgi:hypothetical protein
MALARATQRGIGEQNREQKMLPKQLTTYEQNARKIVLLPAYCKLMRDKLHRRSGVAKNEK